MIDMNLDNEQFAKDYNPWSSYYNYMQSCFYVTRISKQCSRFKRNFPWNMNFWSLNTDKFVLTEESNRATIGRNFDDTHFVQDSYYNVARYIFRDRYNNPKFSFNDKEVQDLNKQAIKNYLIKKGRCVPKAFAMQYVIGAIEASDIETFDLCMGKIRIIKWDEAMTDGLSKWDVSWDGVDL